MTSENLTRADLLSLLQHDDDVRALIRAIVATPGVGIVEAGHGQPDPASMACSAEPEIDLSTSPATEQAAVATSALHEQLGPELLLLQLVKGDADIADAWLGEDANEGRQLLQLVVCIAQWDMLSDLWDKLAQRCRQAQRMASPDELYILQTALALHNLRWRGRQARLVGVAAGAAYDYEHHQRGCSTGDQVRAQWLPGLVNAGGQLQKKALVQT